MADACKVAMSGKSGHRVTGKKPEGSTRTSAKTDGAFGKEGVDQLRSERELNRDNATLHSVHDSDAEAGFGAGEQRKKTSEADALHCPTCGRRFESEQGLNVHRPDCEAAARASAAGHGQSESEDAVKPTHQFKATP